MPFDPKTLADRYLTGISLRQLGLEVGRHHLTVRYHLRKIKGYRKMVTDILLARLKAAHTSYSITRTRSNQRRLKHTLAMLRQKRPAIYKRMVERLKPKRCSSCAKPIQARLSAGMWIWSCDWCGKGGIERCLVL